MKKKALSTLELLIVIAMFLTLMSVVVTQTLKLFFRNEIEIAVQEMEATLRRANSFAVNQVYDSAWGVQFDSATKTYTLFSGTGYDTRTTSRDLMITLPDTISYNSITLTGGGTGVVFDQVTGETSQDGTIVLIGSESNAVTVRVTPLGAVNIE